VADQTERFTRWKPASPAAAWYVFIFFVKKGGFFRPAGGDIPHQTRDRLMHVSIGRFAVFAHFVVFVVQMPTA